VLRKELKKTNQDSPLVDRIDENRMMISSKIFKKVVYVKGVDDSNINNVENAYAKLTELIGGAVDRNKFKQFLLTIVIF